MIKLAPSYKFLAAITESALFGQGNTNFAKLKQKAKVEHKNQFLG